MTMSTDGDDAAQIGTGGPVARARAVGYSEDDIASVPPEAILGMGCGNPVALATLVEGEVVVDLGCGAGFDVFLAAARVGPTGRVIGVDRSEDMLAIARAAAQRAGCGNVEFHVATIDALPLGDASVDVVVSNCVLSDIADRGAAFSEAARVLRPGGRVMISDLVLTQAPPSDLAMIPEIWAGWIAHAPMLDDYLGTMARAGLRDVGIVEERRYSSPGMPAELVGRIAAILVRAVR